MSDLIPRQSGPASIYVKQKDGSPANPYLRRRKPPGSSHSLRRLQAQLQNLAQRDQVGVIWTFAIQFPVINCGIADIHLRRDIPDPELLLLASAAQVRSEADFTRHVSVS